MGKKIIIFSEINEHLRNTENKYISISTSYIGLITIIVSLIYSNKDNGIIDFKKSTILLLSFISIIGCIVYVLQKWYRMWKEHYIDIAQNIVSEWKIENEFIPFWLREKPDNPKFTFDNILGYFTWSINFATIVVLAINLTSMFACKYLNIIIPIMIVLIFILFTLYINSNIHKNKKHSA